MSDLFDRLIIDGSKLDANVAGRVTGARLTRTMDGASSLELGLWDGDGLILSSGVLSRRGKPPKDSDFDRAAWARFGLMRLTLDGWFTRLGGLSGDVGETLTLTFEDEVASIMRRHTGPLKVGKISRNEMTRLDFIEMFANRSPFVRGRVNAPEAAKRRRIKGDTAKERAKEREKGIAPWTRLMVKRQRATKRQIALMEEVLAVADEELASDRATLAMIVANIGEAEYDRHATNPTSGAKGLFQILPRYWHIVDWDDIEKGARIFLTQGFTRLGSNVREGAIQIARDHPDLTPGEIAARVEGSDADGAFYDQWLEQAKKILEAWGGVGKVRIERRRYEFEVARDENYWDASGRLVDQVRFRRFATGNVLHLVSDDYLFSRVPVFLIEGTDTPGVSRIHLEADVGIPVGEVTVTASKPRWTGRPGNVVELGDQLGPLAGRWLLQSIEEDLFEMEPATLILRRPAPALPEPKADKLSVNEPASDALAYPLSRRGKNLGGPEAHARRPFGNWQSDNAIDLGVPMGTTVYAVDDGVISRLGGEWNGGQGNPDGFNITLKTGDNEWFYTHLRYRVPLSFGAHVSRGQTLGTSGAGNGVPHLHLGVRKGDPVKLLRGAPIPT